MYHLFKSNLAKQGSLAQSQHFDQLEALWNKRSPPRRRLHQVGSVKNGWRIHFINPPIFYFQSLSKQSSLAESHLDSSDEEARLD